MSAKTYKEKNEPSFRYMNAPKAALAFLGYEFRKVRDRHYWKKIRDGRYWFGLSLDDEQRTGLTARADAFGKPHGDFYYEVQMK